MSAQSVPMKATAASSDAVASSPRTRHFLMLSGFERYFMLWLPTVAVRDMCIVVTCPHCTIGASSCSSYLHVGTHGGIVAGNWHRGVYETSTRGDSISARDCAFPRTRNEPQKSRPLLPAMNVIVALRSGRVRPRTRLSAFVIGPPGNRKRRRSTPAHGRASLAIVVRQVDVAGWHSSCLCPAGSGGCGLIGEYR